MCELSKYTFIILPAYKSYFARRTNKRTDEYGGSIPARARFALEVTAAVTRAVGANRTAIRLSPWSTFQDMRMDDPLPTYSYLITQLRDAHPDMAYIHVTESAPYDEETLRTGVLRSASGREIPVDTSVPTRDLSDPLRTIWKGNGRVFITCDGYNRETALRDAREKGEVVAFGKWFISNVRLYYLCLGDTLIEFLCVVQPDLPRRLRENLPLNAYDASTFYGVLNPKGYIDYPFADEIEKVSTGALNEARL